MIAQTAPQTFVGQLNHLIHSRFLALLFVSYAAAAAVPLPGLQLRHLVFAHVTWLDGSTLDASFSVALLSLLLFNAGLGIKAVDLAQIKRKPIVIITGLLANVLVPLLLVLGLRGLMGLWHNSDELQNLLVGLALVIAMPIAGSSAAWSQNANGNLGLSLGLILISTLLSPVTTPLVLNTFGLITSGDYSSDLHEIAQGGTNAFLYICVILPSLAGIFTRLLAGEQKILSIKPYIKLANFIVLLVLNYANAAVALPQAVRHPDWDFLAFIAATTLGICIAAFAAGWILARVFKADASDKASLMFGLGMNNNGTGLVLASATLADHPAVFLPMIFYTLVQQFLAGIVDWLFFKGED